MKHFMKTLAISIMNMLTVILCICFMQLSNEITGYNLMALGLMSAISVIGCIAATVGISMTNTES
jgi:hypothetical protein